MKGTIFILLLVLLICNISLAQDSSQNIDGITYKSGFFEDPSGRFTLTVPPEWEGYSETRGGDVSFITYKEPAFGSFWIKFLKFQDKMTLKDLKTTSLKEFDGNKGFKILSESNISIDNCPALWLHMCLSFEDGTSILSDEYYFIKNSQGYIIHFDTSKDYYERFLPDFNAILNSFKFK